MRGQIENRERRKQIIDFSRIRYKNITPTDIEGAGEFFHVTGYFEIQGKTFIFIEIKYGDVELPDGQKLAFTRIVDALNRPAIYIVAEHDIGDTNQDVMADKCMIRNYYYQHEWHTPKENLTLKTGIDRFLESKGFKNYVADGDVIPEY